MSPFPTFSEPVYPDALRLADDRRLSPQWLALRPHLPKAGWWVLANALAWMLGMVVVFVGTSFIPAQGMTWPVALVLLLFVVAAGALVGAVHGLVLIWLLHQGRLRATA